VHLVGFTIEIYRDARPHERQISRDLFYFISIRSKSLLSTLFLTTPLRKCDVQRCEYAYTNNDTQKLKCT